MDVYKHKKGNETYFTKDPAEIPARLHDQFERIGGMDFRSERLLGCCFFKRRPGEWVVVTEARIAASHDRGSVMVFFDDVQGVNHTIPPNVLVITGGGEKRLFRDSPDVQEVAARFYTGINQHLVKRRQGNAPERAPEPGSQLPPHPRPEERASTRPSQNQPHHPNPPTPGKSAEFEPRKQVWLAGLIAICTLVICTAGSRAVKKTTVDIEDTAPQATTTEPSTPRAPQEPQKPPQKFSVSVMGLSASSVNGSTKAKRGHVFVTAMYEVTNHTTSSIADPMVDAVLFVEGAPDTRFHTRDYERKTNGAQPVGASRTSMSWMTFELPKKTAKKPLVLEIQGRQTHPMKANWD